MRQRAGIILRIGRNLRKGDVAGRLDEFFELPVRDRYAVDEERIDRHGMDRRLFGIMLVRPHPEGTTGNRDHTSETFVGLDENRAIIELDDSQNCNSGGLELS